MSMSKKDSSTRSPGMLRKFSPGRKAGIAFMDSGERLRFEPEIVRRDRQVARWGLLIREPRLFTERLEQFFSVNDVREGGQAKDGIAAGEKEPLNWRR